MKLSEKITQRRTDRLDEWSMDGLSKDVAQLEGELCRYTACMQVMYCFIKGDYLKDGVEVMPDINSWFDENDEAKKV